MMLTLIAAVVTTQAALAQTPRTPAGANAAPPGSSTQPPLEPSAPSGAPASVTTPQVESSGSSGTQQEAGVEQPAPPATPAERLKPQTAGDVTYLCGGVGKEEVRYMKRQAGNYDMMLTFAARDGSYLADVNVNIADAKGNPVLKTSCDGPLLLVNLPRSGTYQVHAEAAGYQLNQTAKVEARHGKRNPDQVASLVLSWPQRYAQGSAATATGASGAAGASKAGSGEKEKSGK